MDENNEKPKTELPPEHLASVSHIDTAKVKRLKERGHLMSMYEEFEVLRIKFMYDKLTEKQDAIRFVTLLKYFAENGPSEAMRLSCTYMLEKHVKKLEWEQT